MAASDAAAAPKNSHFARPEQSSNNHQAPSKSDSNALCKTLILLILVLLIPLFPSQAPEFITQTVLTDFWEIIHLLFIGIAVSYGLFGRRTAQTAPDGLVDSRTDDSHAYLSGISHLTAIFDDGYENVCYEHDTMNSCVNLDGQFLGKDGCVVHSGVKIRSLVPNDGNESVSEGNVNRAWYSRHSKGEPLVVVSNGKCFLDGDSDFKSLNLPVRSLRSRALDNDKHEFKNRNEFSPKVEAKGDGDDDVNVVKIRGVVPMNLEKKFEELAGRSTIPWRSRSGRMEVGEEMSSSMLPAHSRPHSVGEFEFEHLKSRSIRGSRVSPELKSSNVENLERKRVFAASRSKVAPIDSEASSLFSSGISASSGMNGIGNLENNPKNSGVEEEARKGKPATESLDSDDSKSSFLAKALPRAKSVRTIKPKRYTMNQKEQCPNRGDGKFGRVFVKSEADILIKRREEEPENPSADHQNQESAHIFSMPKPIPTLPEFQNEEKQDIDDRNSTKSEDTVIEFDKSSVEDDTRTHIDNDSELGSEVDRKADEFIAKFREQIRLQKTSSVEGFSGW